jgi:hypothetical protein
LIVCDKKRKKDSRLNQEEDIGKTGAGFMLLEIEETQEAGQTSLQYYVISCDIFSDVMLP